MQVIEKPYDPYRKRRELTDLACATFGAAWNPGQFVGLDEAVRPHKHWGRMRIRFKAAVHSGALVDSLNCCSSKYCLWFEEHHWLLKHAEGNDSEVEVVADPNTLKARMCRAFRVLLDEGKEYSTANYCVSLDRGYGHIEAQRAAAEMGIYTNAMMATTRVGLPRAYLQELEDSMKQCPPDCSHAPNAKGCMKFTYTMCHKESTNPDAAGAAGSAWELSCWMDSQLIVSYGNFSSGSRCGELGRGSHSAKESYSVWAPESVWHYNVQGRSATDGADQLRKKMNLSERRIVRAGHKGTTFAFDLAFTNATIIWEWLRRETATRTQLDKDFNKV